MADEALTVENLVRALVAGTARKQAMCVADFVVVASRAADVRALNEGFRAANSDIRLTTADVPAPDADAARDAEADATDEESDAVSEKPFSVSFTPTEYASRDLLIRGAQFFAKQHKFAVSIESAKSKAIYIACTRSGPVSNKCGLTPETRRRRPTSRKCNCPFRLKGVHRDDGSWMLQLVNGHHNHSPAASVAELAIHRRMTREQREKVHKLAADGVKSQQILAALKADDAATLVSIRDIYNERGVFRREEMNKQVLLERNSQQQDE